MAIAQVASLRILPGRLDDFISRCGEAKKILEGHGSTVTFYRTLAGPTPNTVLFISSVPDWPTVAKVAAKVEADTAWRALERKSVEDPVAETLSSGMIQDFKLP
jgi:hypothetical protein